MVWCWVSEVLSASVRLLASAVVPDDAISIMARASKAQEQCFLCSSTMPVIEKTRLATAAEFGLHLCSFLHAEHDPVATVLSKILHARNMFRGVCDVDGTLLEKTLEGSYKQLSFEGQGKHFTNHKRCFSWRLDECCCCVGSVLLCFVCVIVVVAFCCFAGCICFRLQAQPQLRAGVTLGIPFC